MIVRGTRWVYSRLHGAGGPWSVEPAGLGADDVRPPTLVCVDGLLTRSFPDPENALFRRRRWFCDVDGKRTACVPSGVAVACAPNARFRASGATSQCLCRSVRSNRKEA